MSSSTVFSGAEVVQMVVEAESIGVDFYECLAGAMRSGRAKNVFMRIREEEQQHLAELERLSDAVGAYRAPEMYAEEYYAYLRALVKSRVFTDKQTCRRMAKNAWDEAAAAQLASDFEKEVILFLYEMRRLVLPRGQSTVDGLLEGEREHLRQLQTLGQDRPAVHAIISDIHDNLPALKAVLADINSKGITRVICLGDVVGYGPNPAECVDLARRRCDVTLCGNHDFAVVTEMVFGFNGCAKKAVAWTRQKLRPGPLSSPEERARWRFLENLPERHQEGRILYVHGSPRSHMEYIEYIMESDADDIGFGPSDKLRDIFASVEWLCFVGHTHDAGIFTGDYKYIPSSMLPESSYEVPKEGKTIVNVGSVGQPRDGDPRACYVTFDGEAIQYHRVEYDVDRVTADIERIAELDDRLGTRLKVGK